MALPTLLLTSCLKEQEDLFEKPASIRVAEYLDNVKSVLTSSENGWVLNYYPDRAQSYGGIVYTLKFDDQNVTVGTEIADDITETIKSAYILDNEDGPCIAFDTYNEYLHYFATPTGSSGAGGYEAYDGDFIFIIMNVSEDKNTIKLKGNRSGNIMYMHRLTSDPTEYVKGVINTQNTMPTNYTCQIGGENIDVSLSSGQAVFAGDQTDASTAFIYTPTGVEFYEPITINDIEITGVKNNGEASTTTSLGTDPVEMTVVWLPLNQVFVNNDWYLSYSNLSEYTQTFFDSAIAGSQSEGEEISMMAFTLQDDVFCLYFQSGKYGGALAFDVEYIGENQVKLTYNAENNLGDGTWYYKNAGYNKLIDVLQTTFTLESNSKVRPTVITLTDNNNPDNVINVVSGGIGFMN